MRRFLKNLRLMLPMPFILYLSNDRVYKYKFECS